MALMKSRYRMVWSTPAPMSAPLKFTPTNLCKPTLEGVYPLLLVEYLQWTRLQRRKLDRDSHDRGSILGAMRQLTHGVYVLGTRRGRQSNAMTASLVMQASERPPCVAVAVRAGDHTVIVGEVTAGETLADGYPLIYDPTEYEEALR